VSERGGAEWEKKEKKLIYYFLHSLGFVFPNIEVCGPFFKAMMPFVFQIFTAFPVNDDVRIKVWHKKKV
jgi:hypothetical protein